MAKLVEDPRHPLVRRIADVLRSRSAKPRTFLIDDLENIEQAVRSGIRLDSAYVTEKQAPFDAPALRAVAPEVPCHVLAGELTARLFGEGRLARTFALAHAPRPPRLRDLSDRPGDVVVLDGVRLMGNIGAIVRTAAGFGAAGVVLLDSGVRTVLDRRLIRASRGLVFTLPVVLTRHEELTAYLRQERVPVVTLTAQATEPLTRLSQMPGRLALVLGSERHGVSEPLEATAWGRFAIRMAPQVESLNVSVAAAIALYEHGRRQGEHTSAAEDPGHVRQPALSGAIPGTRRGGRAAASSSPRTP